MKRIYVVILGLGIILLLTGAIGSVVAKKGQLVTNRSEEDQYVGYISNNESYYSGMNGMMGRNRDYFIQESQEAIELESLILEVEKYIANYEETLEISDIFIFKDSEYYFSIIESETGKGAMELLVNQYTGDIFPEIGPNMMWNLKYGMHYTGGMMNGRSMMGGRGMYNRQGMMGYNNDDYTFYDSGEFSENNDLSSDEAYNKGEAYLTKYADELRLEEKFHEFYGYYTFHVTDENQSIGMLSVNGFTGEVWYHDWHGDLLEVVELHEENH